MYIAIQGYTGVYMGVQSNTGVYMGVHSRGIQEYYMGLQGFIAAIVCG